MTILLDNGHGKETPGKRSPVWDDIPQIFEWEYTRKLAKEIQNKLIHKGYNCELIVPEDNDITLTERVQRVNKFSDCILISIHLNAFDKSSKAKGWEIHSYPNSKKSKLLAKCFENSFILKNFRGLKESDFYILKKTNCPAVLTENYFMTNYEDCKYLLSDDGFNELVSLHINAIIKYIKDNN